MYLAKHFFLTSTLYQLDQVHQREFFVNKVPKGLFQRQIHQFYNHKYFFQTIQVP